MMQISCQFEIHLDEKRRRFCQNRRVYREFHVDLATEEVEKHGFPSKIVPETEKISFPRESRSASSGDEKIGKCLKGVLFIAAADGCFLGVF
ncbi:UNVERIFIED_ORG: hypothetical protein GGI63_003369 [Rhizobium esperanzae]